MRDRLLVYLLARLREEHKRTNQHPWVPLKDKVGHWVCVVCPCGEYKILVEVVNDARARTR